MGNVESTRPVAGGDSDHDHVSPEQSASWISVATSSWVSRLLLVGWRKPLDEDDLYPVLPSRRCRRLADTFEAMWEEQARRGSSPSVFGICARMFWTLPLWGLVKSIADACQAITSLMLRGLVQFLVSSQGDSPPEAYVGFLYALGLLLLNCTSSVCNSLITQRSAVYAVAIKGMLTTAIYRKALRLSGLSRSQFSPGKIMNMVSTDLGRIELAALQLNLSWTFPIWFIITAGLLYRIIGVSGFAGLAIMVICVPLQGYMISHLMRIRKRAAGIGDTRVKGLFDAAEVAFHPKVDKGSSIGVEIRNGTFAWESSPPDGEEGSTQSPTSYKKLAENAEEVNVDDLLNNRPSLRNINLSQLLADKRKDIEATDSKEGAPGGSDYRQITTESRTRGDVKSAVFLAYLRNFGSVLFVALTVVGLVSTQATRLANDLWLVSWIENLYSYLGQGQYMGVYAGLGLAQALALLIYSVQMGIGGVHAAERLHDKVLASSIASPVGFFDQTPLGRIVNRLSRDIDYADNSIYDALRLLFYSFLQLVTTFALVSYFTRGIFLAILVPLLVVYYYTQLLYRRSSRELKRIESITVSPLYAHVSESMSGLSTIRAYRETDRFVSKCEHLVDKNGSPLYLLYSGQRWLQLRVEMIGNLLHGVNPSQMGLALSYLLQTTALLNMVIFQIVEAEVQLNAIERLVEYLNLKPEEDPKTPKLEPPTDWPHNGTIEFNDAKMRYQPALPLVLRGVNLSIKGGEKVGVVGRTGSGKSSIMQTLFRIVNLCNGSIVIDGVDISQLSLRNLRSRLAIIPQDPVLFSGTLRTNLDPRSDYNDAALWDVLERCGMRDAVAAMDGGLDAAIVENGENISVGQRQLLCLARAVLLRPKIIILDECTASVDMENDALIQKTIRTEFAAATTLT
ncbi:Multidrug resistance-associated protein 1, partial [Cladochytrium tenue]